MRPGEIDQMTSRLEIRLRSRLTGPCAANLVATNKVIVPETAPTPMEEATEHLVRLYLETKGYVVTTNKVIKLPQHITTKTGPQEQLTPFEVDIVAVHPGNGDRILGDVKSYFGSYGLRKAHFKDLGSSKPRLQKRMRLFNDEDFAKRLLGRLDGDYGGKFRVELYIGKIKHADANDLLNYLSARTLDGRPVRLVRFDEVMRTLIRYIRDQGTTYFNDQVIQTIKVLDALGFLSS